MLLQQLVNGVTQGATYALIAIGFALIFGVLGLIQFAHGEVYLMGAYVAYVFLGMGIATGLIGTQMVIALVIGILGGGLAGIAIERICFRPLRLAPVEASCLATIGMSFIIKDAVRLTFGAETQRFIADNSWVRYYYFGPVGLSNVQMVIILVSVVLVCSLQFILYRTNAGRAIRALSQDQMAARLMGVDVDHVIMNTFALGSGLGGAAGALIGLYYNAVFPTMGFTAGIKAFAATILGGLTSIPGAALGGLVLGVAENLGSATFGEDWRDGITFLVFFIMLVVRPSGLFGDNAESKL